MMLMDREVTAERPLSGRKQDGFKTQVSSSCCIFGDSEKDIDRLQAVMKSPPDTSIHITKETTQALTRLSFTLPFRITSKYDDIRVQYRCMTAQGSPASVKSSLTAAREGKDTPFAKVAPTHTSTWQGQITVSENWATFADLDAGRDALIWALEFETDPVSCDLIDVSISAGDAWVVFKGTELLSGEACVRDESGTPAGDDLAGLIRVFETQYDAWGKMRQALAEEIDYLRRRLDEAHLKVGTARGR